jgi:glucan 1,3-beta-glucosidase
LLLGAICFPAALASARPTLPAIRTDGTRWVGADGNPVALQGVNLGNWLILERWMFRYERDQWADQYELEKRLTDRFGEATKDRLLDVHREHWIGDEEMRLAKSFGFNTVRVPFHYGLLVAEDQPASRKLKPGAFRWLDRAVELAERHGMYLILGMHSVPGGQSDAHHTWRADRNQFWDQPEAQRQVAWLWGQIAGRYADRSHVAAYDLINEPYGVDGERAAELLPAVTRPIFEAIRDAGSEQVVLLPGPAAPELSFYPPPAEAGWDNVGFTLHEYPGRYGHERSAQNILDWFEIVHPLIQKQLDRLDAPFLMGEFNVNFRALDGPALQRRQFESYLHRGWASTIWCLKLVRDDDGRVSSFALLTNTDPISRPDLRTAGEREIEAYFTRLGEMNYTIDDTLRRTLRDLFSYDCD